MKVVFITIGEPLSQIESFLFTEIENIVHYNKNITIFPLISNKLSGGSNLFGYIEKFSLSKKIKIVSLQIIKKNFRLIVCLIKLLLNQKPKRFLYSLYFLPKTLVLIDIIETKRIEHIHAYWGSTPATCALLANLLTGVPFSFTLHRADIDNNDILAIKASKAVFLRCISKKGYRDCLKYCPAKKLRILHMGVNIPPFHKTKKASKVINIVTVARLVPIKRIPELVRAVSRYKDLKLTLIGDGSLRDQIEKLIVALELNKRVKLLGHLSQEQIFSLYKKRIFDLFVLPSADEGIPVSAMEAMAYNIPTALTKVGATNELINKNSGYFLKFDLSNLRDIADKIPQNNKLTHARKTVVDKFNARKNAAELLKFFANEK